MGFKSKISLTFALSLVILSLYTAIPIRAFTSDSFSQQVGDEIIWEFKVADSTGIFGDMNVGDQLKAVITTTNQSTESLGPVIVWDIVWAAIFNNSVTNTTWTLYTEGEIPLGLYNSSYGFIPQDVVLIVPHNETAVEAWVTWMGSMAGNSTWTSGSHGYDGKYAVWEGDVTIVGSIKLDGQFNSNGIMKSYKFYNATGTNWETILHLELVSTGKISGFLILPAFLILTIFLAIYALNPKKKTEYSLQF